MNTIIVCGSIQDNSSTLIVCDEIKRIIPKSDIVNLAAFRKIFTGDYIDLNNADKNQLVILSAIAQADVIIFVVPTYYKSMPGILKNFFDIVKEPSLYDKKIISIVASNSKNQDYGARHALEVIQGVVTYLDVTTTIIPEIIIIDHQNINQTEIIRSKEKISNYYSLN